MNKCSCYHTYDRWCYTSSSNAMVTTPTIGVCWGTKERDECSCGGDPTKCDFYPDVRKKANKAHLKKSVSKRLTDVTSMINNINVLSDKDQLLVKEVTKEILTIKSILDSEK